MPAGTRGEATVQVQAPPEKVYELVSDVTRMGEWSPECVRSEWVEGATGPAVGAKFKGWNKRGIMRWSTVSEVVAADAGKEFAFRRPGPLETIWRYRMQPIGGGTELNESFELVRPMGAAGAFLSRLLMGVKDRRSDMEEGMRTTLERIKSAAESST